VWKVGGGDATKGAKTGSKTKMLNQCEYPGTLKADKKSPKVLCSFSKGKKVWYDPGIGGPLPNEEGKYRKTSRKSREGSTDEVSRRTMETTAKNSKSDGARYTTSQLLSDPQKKKSRGEEKSRYITWVRETPNEKGQKKKKHVGTVREKKGGKWRFISGGKGEILPQGKSTKAN